MRHVWLETDCSVTIVCKSIRSDWTLTYVKRWPQVIAKSPNITDSLTYLNWTTNRTSVRLMYSLTYYSILQVMVSNHVIADTMAANPILPKVHHSIGITQSNDQNKNRIRTFPLQRLLHQSTSASSDLAILIDHCYQQTFPSKRLSKIRRPNHQTLIPTRSHAELNIKYSCAQSHSWLTRSTAKQTSSN